jgi:outer membrane protein
MAIVLSAVSLAQQPQAANKMAVINGQAALANTEQGKKALEQLRAKFETRKKEFEARQSEVAQLEDQLAKGAAVMAGDKREQLAKTLSDKKKRLQRDLQDADEDTQRDQQLATQTLDDRLNTIINKYASDNGYSVVIDFSVPGNPVRYAAGAIDITKEVVALYDKTYGK